MKVIHIPHIKQLIESGDAMVGSINLSSAFDKYICDEYEWEEPTGFRIDWSGVLNVSRINWLSSDEAIVEEFIRTSCLGLYEKVCVIYGANQEPLIVNLDFVSTEIDALMCHGIGTRFIVGVKEISGQEVILDKDCFIEVDGNRYMTTQLK